MTDLRDDFQRMEVDYEIKCRGPSKTEININTHELEERLSKTLKLRVATYKQFSFMILVGYASCWFFWFLNAISDESLTTVVATVTAVSTFFYMTNPLLQETIGWCFLVDAFVDNCYLAYKVLIELTFGLSDQLLGWGYFAVDYLSNLLKFNDD